MSFSRTLLEPGMTTRSDRSARRLRGVAVAACLLGCGCSAAEADGPPNFEAIAAPERDEATASAPRAATPLTSASGAPSADENPSLSTERTPAASAGCEPGPGVSGAPETISEAIELLNTLPRPTTLACFIEALDRPLSVYMTKSDDSLQPSPGARSPRAFILRGELELSIVLDGSASNTLEFGFRSQASRSIKAEVLFPVTTDVSEASLFDRVQVTPRTTKCGACHVAEAHVDYPGFPLGVFESDILTPFEFDQVGLDSLAAEAQTCDAAREPYRCGLLSALFDHGAVTAGVLRGLEP